jgi:hypothetical protein
MSDAIIIDDSKKIFGAFTPELSNWHQKTAAAQLQEAHKVTKIFLYVTLNPLAETQPQILPLGPNATWAKKPDYIVKLEVREDHLEATDHHASLKDVVAKIETAVSVRITAKAFSSWSDKSVAEKSWLYSTNAS